MDTYKIKIVEASETEALNKFFQTVYKPDHIVTDHSYFSWQYRTVPGNQFFPRFSSLVLLKDNQIIGHLGMIPYLVNVFGEQMRAAYFTNLIIKPEFRSHGAGAFLLKEAEKYFDLVYTTGYNEAMAPIYQALFWSKEEKMNRWVFENFSDLEPSSSPKIITVKKFDASWEKNWQNIKKHFPVTIDRSQAYLNWRFANNPKIQYQIFGIMGGARQGITGCIVLRLERGNDFAAARIVDLIASPENAEPLLAAGLAYAKAEQVHFADFFCTSPLYDTALKELKFYLYNNKDAKPPIFILPTDRRKIFVNFSYKFTKKELNPRNEDWLVTKSDGDRDRPQ